MPSTAALAIPLCFFFFRARHRDTVLGGVLWQRSLPRLSSTINWWNSTFFFRWFVMVFMESFEQPKHFVAGFFGSNDMGFWCSFFLKVVVFLLLLLGWDHWEFFSPKSGEGCLLFLSWRIMVIRGNIACGPWGICEWSLIVLGCLMQLELHRNSTNSACPWIKMRVAFSANHHGSVEDGCL